MLILKDARSCLNFGMNVESAVCKYQCASIGQCNTLRQHCILVLLAIMQKLRTPKHKDDAV